MLLGKRPRPSIRRTTSMTGITVDVSPLDASGPSDAPVVPALVAEGTATVHHNQMMLMNPFAVGGYDERFLATVSPGDHQRNNVYVETPHFLRTCGLCKRRLGPGRDIYMYRGDTAFCSLECREQQMKQDERKEKKGVRSSKKEVGVID